MLKTITSENFGVISDFDRTFTKGEGETAFSVFDSCPSIPEGLKKAQRDNYIKYRPIEIDLSMDPDERNKHMHQWHEAAMDAFSKYLTQERFMDAIQFAQENIELRDGMLDFSHKMEDQGVPLIISSAGVSNVITGVLEHHGVPHQGIHGNDLKFDDMGRFVGLGDKQAVHNDGKNWGALPQYLIDVFSDRTNILVMGDAIGDVKMGPADRNTLNLGFLLQAQKGHEEKFRNTFDYVIESDDCDKGFLSEVSRHLIKK